MDIILTWPKKRKLASYVEEVKKAATQGKVVCFRVTHLPKKAKRGDRAYMVHDGYIRGYMWIVGLTESPEGAVVNPITGDEWPAGNYIMRFPQWHELKEPIPMKGFRGFRYRDT